MPSDLKIQNHIEEELKWDPALHGARINVLVKNGIVTLSGEVDSYIQKISAEKDAKKIAGVRAIAENIHLRVLPPVSITDATIAEAVVNALKWHSGVQEHKINITVEDGNVVLDGEVDWEYQRAYAEMAVANIAGVKSVRNLICLKPKYKARSIREQIIAGLSRIAGIDPQKIAVEVVEKKVVLSGMVSSFAEKEQAERVAWNAPGINKVESRLYVEVPTYDFED
ncbi:MAG: BON domain-containing protein [Agriterribacter sp.]